MIPSIKTIHAEIANGLLGLFFDIDETFTTHGRIHSAAYRALWELKAAKVDPASLGIPKP